MQDELLEINGQNFILHSDLKGKLASLVDSFWYPEFGLEIPNKFLELKLETPELDVEFTWSKH